MDHSQEISNHEPHEPTFKCSDCTKEYKHKRGLLRHRNSQHLNIKHTCANCGSQFGEKHDLKRHERTCNGGTSSKRKADNQVNDSPSKKQKLNELIAFEVSI